MSYKCIKSFTNGGGKSFHYGEEIVDYAYNSLGTIAKSNFEKVEEDDVDEASSLLTAAFDLAINVLGSSSDDSSSSSNDSDSFGGFGGGDAGGGGAGGDW